MAGLIFAKKNPLKPAGQVGAHGTQPAPKSQAQKSAVPSFMKRGAEAKQTLAEEEARAEQRRAEQGKMFRFRMPPGEDRRVTFLDGDLDEDGMLDINMFYEHTLQVAGNWHNYVCTEEQDGWCPLCDRGDTRKSYSGVMTVIDHSEHVIKSGPNAGKKIKNTRKLYVVKQSTLKILVKLAMKRGGLAGCTFDVSRGDDKSAAVGSQFDFSEKHELSELPELFDMKPEDCVPADYGKELTYVDADQLVSLGLGKAPSGPGYEKPSGEAKKKLAQAL